MDPDEEAAISGYVEASGARKGSGYAVRLEELAWLLGHALRRSTDRLSLLTALQRSIASPMDPEGGASSEAALIGDLKGALTDVIIMQTRLAGREEGLVELLNRVAERRLAADVPLDKDVLARWAEGIMEARRHLGSSRGREGRDAG